MSKTSRPWFGSMHDIMQEIRKRKQVAPTARIVKPRSSNPKEYRVKRSLHGVRLVSPVPKDWFAHHIARQKKREYAVARAADFPGEWIMTLNGKVVDHQKHGEHLMLSFLNHIIDARAHPKTFQFDGFGGRMNAADWLAHHAERYKLPSLDAATFILYDPKRQIVAKSEGRMSNPLRKGRSRAVISSNIRELMHAGHPQRQAIAIAFREAGLSRRKNCGTMRSNPKGTRMARRTRSNAPLTAAEVMALKSVLGSHGFSCNPPRRTRGRRNPGVTIHGSRGGTVARFTAGTKNRRKIARRFGKRTYAQMVKKGKKLAAKHGFQTYTAKEFARNLAKARRGWLAWRRRQIAKRR